MKHEKEKIEELIPLYKEYSEKMERLIDNIHSEEKDKVEEKKREESSLLKKVSKTVEPGFVIISVGLASLSIVFIQNTSELYFKILASIVFILSGYAAGQLCWTLVVSRITETMHNFPYKDGLGNFKTVFWFGKRWFNLTFRSLIGGTFKRYPRLSIFESTELGYLNLILSIAILWIISLLWVIKELFFVHEKSTIISG